MLPTKPVCKKIIFLYFHESSIIAQYSRSVWINHAAGAVSVCMCVLRCSPGAPVVWGPSPSLCLINQSCTGLQAAGLRCPQEQMCTEPPSLSLSPEQVSSARPCSEGLLRVACVCGCNWLATVTTEAQRPCPCHTWLVGLWSGICRPGGHMDELTFSDTLCAVQGRAAERKRGLAL